VQKHLPLISDRVLCVIDMQIVFTASQHKKTLLSASRQIRHAMQNGWAIVFVEFYGHGKTDYRLVCLTEKYARTSFVTKHNDDGSAEIMAHCHVNNLPNDYFRVCGVNTAACVRSTVRGLQKKATVEVYGPACNDGNHGYGQFQVEHAFDGMMNRPKIIGYRRSPRHDYQAA